jgi:imidazoleglycerol-phosphate dehydratase/histidinol-phosphatase
MINKVTKQKVLFLDRDGVLVYEPEDFQVDHINKVTFPKGLLSSLSRINKLLDYKFVMITNQDGLGTASFPEEDFWPVQELILRTLESEGIHFEEIHIDRSFSKENSPYRKPGIARLTKYMNEDYDLDNSFVIGDRISDMKLAKNLGCKGIRIHALEQNKIDNEDLEDTIILDAEGWKAVEDFLMGLHRKVKSFRKTHETCIDGMLNLDGSGKAYNDTGLKFFDHMLDQLAKHSGIDLTIKCIGDLQVDEHHTIEDVSIVLGGMIKDAIAKKVGIGRYGFALPMDDCRSQVLLDFGGRSWIEWDVEFKREKIGDMPTEMFFHFFKSLADNAALNINIIAKGENEHHKIESIFKAFARAMKMAISRDKNDFYIPTTKGML